MSVSCYIVTQDDYVTKHPLFSIRTFRCV